MTCNVRRMAAAAAVAVLLVATRGRVEAQTEQDRLDALAALKEGNLLFERGEYQAAMDAYRRAYARVPSPKLYFNLGQAARNLDRPLDALDYYERFLDEAQDAAPALRDEAQGHIRDLERGVAILEVRATFAGRPTKRAEVSLDGGSPGTTPLARPVRILPGAHRIVVRHDDGDATYTERIQAKAGDRIQITAVLTGARPPGGDALAPAAQPEAAPAALPGPASAAQGLAPAARSVSSDAPPRTNPPESSPSPRSRRFGLIARLDIDRKLEGAAQALAVSFAAIVNRLEVSAGVFRWPSDDERGDVYGASLGGIVYLTSWPVRPLFSADMQVYVLAGPHWAARLSVGAQWDLSRHLGLFATGGFEHTSAVYNPATDFVPGLGLQLRP